MTLIWPWKEIRKIILLAVHVLVCCNFHWAMVIFQDSPSEVISFFPNSPRFWKYLHYANKNIFLFYLSFSLWWSRYFSFKIKLKCLCSSGCSLHLTHVLGTDIRRHPEFIPWVEILLLVSPFEGIVSASPIKWMPAQDGVLPKNGPGEPRACRQYPWNVDWLYSRPMCILLWALFLHFTQVHHKNFRVEHALHS